MYIPIGPSKKQLYKIIIAMLLLLYLIFLGMYKPKALEISDIKPMQVWSWSNLSTYDLNHNGSSASAFFNPQLSNTDKNRINNSAYDYLVFFVNGANGAAFYSISTGGNDGFQISQFTTKVRIRNSTHDKETYCDTHLENGGYVICRLDKNIQYSEMILETQLPPGLDASMSTNSALNYNIYMHISSAYFLGNSDTSSISSNTEDIKNNLNDSSIDSSSANNLTSNSAFQDSNGLDAIIKAPLNFIQSLTSSTCSSISLTIPYIDANVSLPCMSTIYNKALGSQLVNLIALVINGVVLYRYCLKILQLVHNAKNPNKDELEVLDL